VRPTPIESHTVFDPLAVNPPMIAGGAAGCVPAGRPASRVTADAI
jgi:hypothetical protein